MVALADLLAADPNIWRDQAAAWTRLGGSLDDHAAALQQQTSALSEVWQGGGVDGAMTRSGELATVWRDRAARLEQVGRVLTTHADRIDTARRRAHALVQAAGPTHEIRPDGSIAVTPLGIAQAVLAPWQIPALDARTGRLAAELTDIVNQAGMADEESARALQAATAGMPATGSPGAPSVMVPASTTPPAEVARWWDSLDPAQREHLLSTDPARIGRLDGVPVVDRDRANRIGLEAAHEQLANQRDAALRLPEGDERDEALRVVDEKARALGAIDARLASTTGTPAYLLGLDTTGTGRAIVAVGNPDTADNVITYVPGTGARLGGAAGDVVRADALVASSRLADPSASTAAIAWVGYEAPQAIVGFPPGDDATDPDYAHNAGPQLDRFQDGLRATHEGPPSHNTVLGHSYGSTVVGYGAREHGLDADELVFVGSPGVGADSAAELGHDPNRVWSSHIGNDPIQLGLHPSELRVGIGLPDPSPGGNGLIHGLNPSHPGFGAEVFGAQDGSFGMDAHSEYWDRDSESLLNLGRIATGQHDQVTR